MKEIKQVEKAHYEFGRYMSKERWISVWHQLDEVLSLGGQGVLEVGPGAGIFKEISRIYGMQVDTLDVSPDLEPDFVGSATALPFEDNSYDIVCAFQMLEHLPFELSIQAFKEMVRVSNNHVIISLPDAKPVWYYRIHLPKFGTFKWLVPRPLSLPKKHHFNGQHYWEIGKRGYHLSRVLKEFSCGAELIKTYRVKEHTYHRFLIFKLS